MLSLDNATHQVQAQSNPAVGALIAGLQLPEPLERPLDVLRPNADPSVGYAEPDGLRVRSCGQLHFYPIWGVFARIGGEFCQHRSKADPVAVRLRQAHREGDLERSAQVGA